MKKIITLIALTTVFISFFFALFIVQSMMSLYTKCCSDPSGPINLQVQDLAIYIIVSAMILIFFVVIDGIAAKIMINTLTSSNITEEIRIFGLFSLKV